MTTTKFHLRYKHGVPKKNVPNVEKILVTVGLVYLIFTGEVATYFLFQFRYWDIGWIIIMIAFTIALFPCLIMFCLIARQARRHEESFFTCLNNILYQTKN